MGPGTLEAKFIPLSKVQCINKIVIVRKQEGPPIDKVHYYVLPKNCNYPVLNLIITPFIITWLVLKEKADLILAYHYVPHYYIAFIASFLSGKPYILGQTGSDDQILARKKLFGLFLRYVINHAVQLNVPGRTSLAFWSQIISVDKIKILHSTVDTDYYYPSDLPKEYDFIYVGRLEDYKGIDRIIKAFSSLVSTHTGMKMAIVGYGSLETDYKRMVVDLGLYDNIYFIGFQQEIRSWLWKSRIFIMASECEGLPCALMEAMSCGLICISSLVGNISDVLIDGKTGFGFNVDDKREPLTTMEKVITNIKDFAYISQRAREIIKTEHSYHTSIALWNETIRRIIYAEAKKR